MGCHMAKVLVLYYSSYGHIEAMAEAVADGARKAGADVDIKRVPETAPEVERIERAEAFFASIPATVNHGGDRAYYMPSADRIQLPPFAAFHDAHGYYTTRGHETVHWTRHPSRLDRSFGREKWGDEGYAREELVAELGAAFLAADLGLAIEPRPDHASYLESWIKVLQNDTRAIVQAAAHAERAVAYLHQLAKTDELQAAA